MMFLYAALTALLCISFSSGFTTPLLPEIEETTPALETTQPLEIQASEIQTPETTQTETTQTSETTQAETTPTETTQTETTQTETTQTETTQTPETTQANTTQAETTQTETTPTKTTQTETAQAETTQTQTTQTQTTQTQTTQPPNVFIQKSGQPCTYAGRTSDVQEIGCWGYKRCAEGELVTYWCTHNTVLERDSMTCVRPGQGNTGCSREISCLGKSNGLFANLGSRCQTYYWCHGEVNYANMYCPATLVFNEAIQSCDYPRNVEAPCGTIVLQ